MSQFNVASRDLNLLISLRALLEAGSVTRAGDRLGMKQSAMSATLARLRQHYGDELLVRVGYDFELTPLARVLLVEVQRAVPLIEQSLGAAAVFSPSETTRRFSILAHDLAGLEIRDRIRELGSAAANISIDIVPPTEVRGDAQRWVMQYDFVIAPSDSAIGGGYSELTIDHYVCLLDDRNPALTNGALSWHDFCALPHATADVGPLQSGNVQRRLRECGYSRAPAVITHGFVPLATLVSQTPLVAVVPSRLAERLGPLTGTIGVTAPFGRVEVSESLLWYAGRQHDPGHSWMRDLLLATA